MTNNPMQLFQMMQQSGNPQQFMINMLSQSMSNTPLGANLLKMAQSGDNQSIEQIARNLCQSRGVDFDTEFKAFKQQLGL